jgi:HAD superfamily hydrolase (TIGR01456 family)
MRSTASWVKRIGLAFDIDGVLVRGPHALPRAVDTLKRVQSLGIPHVFLTNGGGKTEQQKAHQMEQEFQGALQIDHNKVILCHTPLQSLLPQYKDKLVLVVGNDRVCSVAKHYGFYHVLNVAQAVNQIPGIWPFKDSLYHQEQRSSKHLMSEYPFKYDVEDIECIFVMYDGLCWGAEMQVIVDVLTNHHTDRDRPSRNLVQKKPIYFTNADIIYKSEFPRPRLAAGSFRVALEAVFKAVTGTNLQFTQFGKPSAATYEYAENVINSQLPPGTPKIETFYGIGDNPASDIRGANNRDGWKSVLVRTGVFPHREDDWENDPNDPADIVEEDVWEAVDRIIRENEK